MLNAAESTIYEAAQDDAEVERKRRELYAPPKDGTGARGPLPDSAKMTGGDARTLMARMAAEDAAQTRRR